MIQGYSQVIIIKEAYDPIVLSFLQNVGSVNFSNLEIKSIDILIKDLRKSGLLNKMVYIHPFLTTDKNTMSYNLIDTSKYKITFSGNAEALINGIRFNSSNGSVSLSSPFPNANTDVCICLCADNISTSSWYDIGQIGGTRQLVTLNWTTYGVIFEIGFTSSENDRLVDSGALSNFIYGFNSKSGEMSIWKDGVKTKSKIGGKSGTISSWTYNAGSDNNQRIYKFSSLSYGFTDSEYQTFNLIVKKYLTYLGRI